MNVQQVELDWLRPAPYNPRRDLQPGDPEYEALRRSVEKFGHVYPVVANKDGTVIGGHQTLKVLRALGRTRVDAVVMDLPPAEERALCVALNKLSGAWDDGKLKALLAGLHAEDFDATVTGFSLDELSALLDLGQPGPRDDELPPAPREVVTKAGDLIILGDHRLVCGDSLDPATVARALDGKLADLCVTSPPYNIGVAYKDYRDKRRRDEYLLFIARAAASAFTNLAAGRFLAWNIGVNPKTYPARQVVALEDAGFTFYRQIVWEKAGVPFPTFPSTMKARRARHYAPNYLHEVVQVMEKPRADGEAEEPQRACWLCGGRGCTPEIELPLAETHEVVGLLTKGEPQDGGRIWPSKKFQNDVWAINQTVATRDIKTLASPDKGFVGGTRHKLKEHPAAYPVELPWALMQFLSAPGELVLDPFGGAGSTLIAAEKCGRRAALCEIDPLYVDVAVERWERFTGKKAERVEAAA